MPTMTRTRRLMLTAAALVCTMTASASWQPASANVPGTDIARGTQIFEQVTARIYGTRADRLAAEALLAARVQQPIVDCMRGKGSDYKPAGSEQQSFPDPAPGDLTAFAPIAETFSIAAQRRNVAAAHDARTNPGWTTLRTTAQRATYDEHLNACLAADESDPGSANPAAQPELAAALADVLAEVEQREGIRAGLASYRSCLSAAGFTVGTWADLSQAIADQFPGADAPWSEVGKDPAWEPAVAAEINAAAVDARCRSDLRGQALGAAAAVLTAFIDEHGGQLAEVDRQWQEIRDRAKVAGIPVT